MLKSFDYLKSDQKAKEFLDFLQLHQPPEYEKMVDVVAKPREEAPKPGKSDLKLNLIKADLLQSDLKDELANMTGLYNLLIKEINRIDQTPLLNPLKNSYYALLQDFKSRTGKFNESMDLAIQTATNDLDLKLDLSPDIEQIEKLSAKIVENQVKSLQAEAWQQQYQGPATNTELSEEDVMDIENDIQRLLYQSENEFDSIQSISLQLALKELESANHTLYQSILQKLDLLIENVMQKLDCQKNMIDVVEQDLNQISAGLKFSKESLEIVDKVKTWFLDQKELYESFPLSDRDQQFIDLSIPIFSKIYDLFYKLNGSLEAKPTGSIHRDPFLRKVSEIANQPIERHETLQCLIQDIHQHILKCNDDIDKFTEYNLQWSKSRVFCQAPVQVTKAERKIQDLIAQMQPDIADIQNSLSI